MQNQTHSIINLKRENFHVGIRKNKREATFNLKRQFNLHNQSYSYGLELLNISGIPVTTKDLLEEITQMMRTLQTYITQSNVFDISDLQVQSLHKCLKYFSLNVDIRLDGFLYNFMFNLLEMVIYNRKSFLRYDDEEEELRWRTIEMIIQTFLQASFNCDDYGQYYLNREELLLDMLNKSENEYLFNSITSLISNLIYDDKTFIIELLKRDIIQKVISKACELQCHLNSKTIDNLLFLFVNLSGRYESLGGYELTFLFQFIQIVMSKDTASGRQISQCFGVMRNLTKELNADAQRSQLIMKILVDYELIQQTCSILLAQDQINMMSGWEFLLNLSYSLDNSLMKVLVESNLILAISSYINTVEVEGVQNNVYMVLGNMFSSNIFIKENIIQYGMVSRITTGFEAALRKQSIPLLNEITYCISNAISQCSQEQLDYFYKYDLLHCMTQYITEVDKDKQDPALIEDMLGVLFNILHFSSEFLEQCQMNRKFQQMLLMYLNSDLEKLSINAQKILDMIEK